MNFCPINETRGRIESLWLSFQGVVSKVNDSSSLFKMHEQVDCHNIKNLSFYSLISSYATTWHENKTPTLVSFLCFLHGVDQIQTSPIQHVTFPLFSFLSASSYLRFVPVLWIDNDNYNTDKNNKNINDYNDDDDNINNNNTFNV